MEPNIISKQNINNTSIESQTNLPTWLKAIFRIYGVGQILAGIIALIIPVFNGFIVSAMGGDFLGTYKLFAFFAVGALPSFILGYGFLKQKGWVISCLAIRLVYSIISPFFIAKTNSPSIINLPNVIAVALLVLVVTHRESLKGKYFAIIPVVLMIITTAFAIFLAFETLSKVQM